MPVNQHALARAFERYGLSLTRADMERIEERAAALVKRGKSIKLTNTRHLCLVQWGPAVLRIVFSKKSGQVVTFLEPDREAA